MWSLAAALALLTTLLLPAPAAAARPEHSLPPVWDEVLILTGNADVDGEIHEAVDLARWEPEDAVALRAAGREGNLGRVDLERLVSHLLGRGEYNDAFHALYAAAVRNPRDQRALAELLAFTAASGQTRACQDKLGEFLPRDPDNPWLWLWAGLCAERAGADNASQLYGQGLRRLPNIPFLQELRLLLTSAEDPMAAEDLSVGLRQEMALAFSESGGPLARWWSLEMLGVDNQLIRQGRRVRSRRGGAAHQPGGRPAGGHRAGPGPLPLAGHPGQPQPRAGG